ncbi:MAG: hypothetical protein AAB425_07550, partial [Bdellovibrionota bacterium]
MSRHDEDLKGIQDRSRELDERVRRFSELANMLETGRLRANIDSTATQRETREISELVNPSPPADRMLEREIDLLRKERELLRFQISQTRSEADRMHAGAENMREELSRALQQLSRFQSQFSEDVEKMARGRTEEVVRQLDQERKQYEEWRQATLANFESIRTVHPLKDTRTFVEGEIQKLLTETRRTPPPPPGTKQVLDQMLHRYLLQR